MRIVRRAGIALVTTLLSLGLLGATATPAESSGHGLGLVGPSSRAP